jgi:hypothetical protein
MAGSPTKFDLIQRRTTKKNSPHRDMRTTYLAAALVEIVCPERGEIGPLIQTVPELGNTIWREHHIVVQEHQPISTAAALALIAGPRDDGPSVLVVLVFLSNDPMDRQMHAALTGYSLFNFWVQRRIVAREDHQIDRRCRMRKCHGEASSR